MQTQKKYWPTNVVLTHSDTSDRAVQNKSKTYTLMRSSCGMSTLLQGAALQLLMWLRPAVRAFSCNGGVNDDLNLMHALLRPA